MADIIKISELENLAEQYNTERIKGSHSKVNLYPFIDLYLQWFNKSKVLFKQYFNETDSTYKDFVSYDTDGNGHYLAGNFTRQYPLFKILLKQIEQMNFTKKSLRMTNVTNKCFIIHGHNDSLKNDVARFVEIELKKEAIVLHEQPNRGKTIIEKFESHSEVDFAIALWTADDTGSKIGLETFKNRPRQNVIFETGYFCGKLGREKVIVLYEDEVEIPSDYNGILFIPIKSDWKFQLQKEIMSYYL